MTLTARSVDATARCGCFVDVRYPVSANPVGDVAERLGWTYGHHMSTRINLVAGLMCGVLAGAVAVMVVPRDGSSIDVPESSAAELELDRLDGADRYATSVRISQETFPAGADTVFLATGQTFPDALAAGPAAATMNGPILLTATGKLPAPVEAELRRLDPSIVYILGGSAAVSTAVETQVKAAVIGQVRRVAGNDRYATAGAVAELAFPTADTLYVAAGSGFADALSAGAPGGVLRRPVLLTGRTIVPAATRAQVARLGNPDVIVLGGSAVVSDAALAELDSLTTGSVERVSGANRYATSAAVSADAFSAANTVFLATGTTFPDALSAAPAATRLGAPILLTNPTCAPAEIIAEVGRLGATRVVALGGQNAVSDAAAALTPCSVAPRPGAGLFATSVNGTTKRIEDQNGDPWFGVGDSAWSLVGQLSRTDITGYMEGIAARGFNLILFSAPEPYYTDNTPAYRNQSGDLPFTGQPFQSTLNGPYWQVVDHAVDEAARLGITCIIVPQYSGYTDGQDGWSLAVEAAYDADPQNLSDYADALGDRYASYPNIIWMLGHDRIPTQKFKAASRLMALRLQARTDHMVIHGGWNDGGGHSTGDIDWNGVAGPDIATDFDTVYVYDEDTAAATAAAWASKTNIFLEGKYEQEQGQGLGDQTLREQMWQAFLSGASAAFLGNNPRWHFDSGREIYPYSGTWEQSVTDSTYNRGTVHAGHMADFIATLTGVLDTVPDTGSTFVRAGTAFGRFDPSLGVVYAEGTAQITLDTTELAGTSSARIRRFDPTNGSFTTVAVSEPQSPSRIIDHPGANSAGGTDYVYVVEIAP